MRPLELRFESCKERKKKFGFYLYSRSRVHVDLLNLGPFLDGPIPSPSPLRVVRDTTTRRLSPSFSPRVRWGFDTCSGLSERVLPNEQCCLVSGLASVSTQPFDAEQRAKCLRQDIVQLLHHLYAPSVAL